jgi:hypothetical protein
MMNKIFTFYINGALNTGARLRGQRNDEGTKVKWSGQRDTHTCKKKVVPYLSGRQIGAVFVLLYIILGIRYEQVVSFTLRAVYRR